jgi:hypothetical protein
MGVMITLKNVPRPEDFPIGSLESRAAARAMLAHKTRDNEYRFRVQYMGFDEVEYIVNETGIVKTIGRVPTMEELATHPAYQDCDPEFLQRQRSKVVE